MSSLIEKLKTAIKQQMLDEKEKAVLLKSVGKVEKKLKKSDFMIEKLTKDKTTISTLLARTSEDLEKSSEVIKKMFGRYLSKELMSSLIEDPSALELGGERRNVTIMMTDLRGFTALSERHKPEQVVQMLNTYFDIMVEIIIQYNGNINEIIGDALLVIFGAPKKMSDRAQKAIACAIEMQNAMDKVNDQNCEKGLPDLEMGIGLNETEVVVGNIGSSKRSKYTAVGSGVNMTSRIESYTVGGQIFIFESVRRELGDILRIESEQEVFPKGAQTAIRIYEVGGIAGSYNLALKSKDSPPVQLMRKIHLRYTVLEGKKIRDNEFDASVFRLSKNCAAVAFTTPVNKLTNLKMKLAGVDERLSTRDFYGKVIENPGEKGSLQLIRFTSVPPEIDAYFQAHLQYTQ